MTDKQSFNWIVVDAVTKKPFTVYLKGPKCGQPVNFETKELANMNAEKVVELGFCKTGDVMAIEYTSTPPSEE